MRDPKRMKPFLDEVEKIWKEKFPDWRFGQLIFNFLTEYGDPFHLEEEDFLVALRAFSEGKDPCVAVIEEMERRQKERIKEEWNFKGEGNICRRRQQDIDKYFGGKVPEDFL